MKRLTMLALILGLTACGGKSTPTSPGTTPPPAPTVTKIINIFGSMNFGGVGLGSSLTNQLTVQNQGNTTLSITGLTGSGGITAVIVATPTNFTVPPGGEQRISLRFTPAAVTNYSGTITVNGDQTSGGNTIQFSGNGNLDGVPIFTRSGNGVTVFDMPTYVRRVRIVGTFTGSCQNFIVHIAGAFIVNEILGSCSIGIGTRYDGTHLIAGGGAVEVLNASGVAWTFTEVR